MTSIASVVAGASAGVGFSLMTGTIARLGQDGYIWQQAGLGDGSSSNTHSNVTQHKAKQSKIQAWLYADTKDALNLAASTLAMMQFNECTVVDQHTETREVILHSVDSVITAGRYAFQGATHPFMLAASMTVEAIK